MSRSHVGRGSSGLEMRRLWVGRYQRKLRRRLLMPHLLASSFSQHSGTREDSRPDPRITTTGQSSHICALARRPFDSDRSDSS